MNTRLADNFGIALDAMRHNRLRSLLSSLGIVFGIAAVVCMVAIGRGARQEILEQLKLLGTNNIIISTVEVRTESSVADSAEAAREVAKYSPGLTLQDARRIAGTIPHVVSVSPEVVVETHAVRAGQRRSAKLVGVTPEFFAQGGFATTQGSVFSQQQMALGLPVCIIGHGAKSRFFAREDPLGRRIKCGSLWLTVVGVLGEKTITDENIKMLGVRNYNMDIYIPITTMLMRSTNRQAVSGEEMKALGRRRRQPPDDKKESYHQLDRLVVRVDDTRYMPAIAEILNRMLKRRHNNVVDFEVTVPELLLQQEQRTRAVFNIVLGAIASISLLVGGIGIMNIMLASVLERIHEIGIRLAVGATPRDIVQQFMCEAVAISVSGGAIGVVLGVAGSLAVEALAGIQTSLSLLSIVAALVVSVGVGLASGLMPARKASREDPMECLRYE